MGVGYRWMWERDVGMELDIDGCGVGCGGEVDILNWLMIIIISEGLYDD